MKKLIKTIIVLIIIQIFCIGTSNVYAQDDVMLNDDGGINEEFSDKLNEELNDSLPGNANEFFKERDMSISEPEGFLKITPREVFGYIKDVIGTRIQAPIKMLGGLFAIILVTSIVGVMGDIVTNGDLVKVYKMVSVMVCLGIIATPLASSIEGVSEAVVAGGRFMISYVPIFSSIIAASGGISVAGSYNIVVLGVSEIFVQIASNYLMPTVGLCMGLCIVEGMNPTISLSGLSEGLKKAVLFLLSFMMTIFIGLLTIQSIVGTAADGVGIKATKFVISNLVPVVGGAISDAYGTLRGSLGIIKAGVGSFGIISLLLTVLPPLISIILTKTVIYLGEIMAEMMLVSEVHTFLKNIRSTLDIAIGILLCFSLMLIVSTTIVMMLGMNLFN